MAPNLLGDLLVLLSLACAAISGVAFYLSINNTSYDNLARRAYNGFTLFTGLAVVYLYYLFFSHEFSVQYVWAYSDSTLPFFYLLSAFWGGQEGTYLLWLFLNALFGYIIIKRGGQYRDWAMVVFTTINLFFLAILIKLSPFALGDVTAIEGAGLNPLLQDPWMVIHPPIIFVGYSMAAVPYAIAMAAMITRDYSSWLRRSFPWVAITVLMLAAGNILGGYWAYKTLGWGGFWGWDPVENSSLVPWFVSLALLHGMIIEKRNGALRKINLLLTSLTFILVIYGTFLTRSGVLSDFSVHSFVDLGINQFLIAFLIFYTVATLAVFLPRMGSVGNVPLNYNYFGKEFVLFGATVLLFAFSIIVLFWSSLPIITGFLMDEPRAADIATYNSFALPMAIIYALLLTASPFLNYNQYLPENWLRKLLLISGLFVAAGVGIFVLVLGASLTFLALFVIVGVGVSMYMMKSDLRKFVGPALIAFHGAIGICIALGISDEIYILYFAVAVMATVSNAIAFASYIPGRLRLSGGLLTHFGFGLMLIGILGSSAFTLNEKLVLPRGESGQAFGFTVSYTGMEHEIDYPKNRLRLTYTDGATERIADPQLYFSERLNGIMRKPYIHKSLLYDYYFSPEQLQDRDTSGDLELAKGKATEVGDFTLLFHGYEMGNHDDGGAVMVKARISVVHGGDTSEVMPAMEMIVDGGQRRTIDHPDTITGSASYPIHIQQILADRGAVAVSIPGLVESGPPDRLILDLSKKPVINLLWLGTAIVMLGGVISFRRRQSEDHHRAE